MFDGLCSPLPPMAPAARTKLSHFLELIFELVRSLEETAASGKAKPWKLLALYANHNNKNYHDGNFKQSPCAGTALEPRPGRSASSACIASDSSESFNFLFLMARYWHFYAVPRSNDTFLYFDITN
jgi:hypothetical protein